MEANNLSIELLVTDRHKQINSWLKTNVPDIKHKYDVWHVAKCKAMLLVSCISVTFNPQHVCSIQEKG